MRKFSGRFIKVIARKLEKASRINSIAMSMTKKTMNNNKSRYWSKMSKKMTSNMLNGIKINRVLTK